MKRPLHLQLRELREDRGLLRRDMAAILDVHENSIGNWDRGVKSPGVYHAIAYARAFRRQLVIVHHGATVCALEDVLPDVSTLRRARGLTQQDVDTRTGLQEHIANSIEQRARTGASLRMSTLEHYLAALDYEICLVSADQLERAA